MAEGESKHKHGAGVNTKRYAAALSVHHGKGVHTPHARSANPEARSSECQETAAEGSSGRGTTSLRRPARAARNTKGYSSTYLAIGFANVRADTWYPPEH